MKQIFISLLMIAFGMNAMAQENSDIILEVGDEQVMTAEFLHIYTKNNRHQELSYALDSLSAYMDLFVNFKLKVVEAKTMGLDTLKSFRSELSGYRTQLAQPYLTDKSVEDELIREAYERSKYDVKASHILIKIDPEITGKDTLAAYNKAKMVRQKLLDGEDFGTLAKKYSDDESVRYNQGSLGYFTVFGMVYPFESAAYNTEVGEISDIVRTRFGYHIIKIEEKRLAKGRIRVAHIMVLLPKDAIEEQQAQAQERVEMIQKKLDAGESFEELAKEFSEDRRSGRQGGLLPWFGVGGKMIPEFENAAFQLSEVGGVSNALRTSYGYHFIKLVDVEPIGSFEEQKIQLKNRISNSARASRSKTVLVERLMDDYNAVVHDEAIKAVSDMITDSIFYGKWDAKAAYKMNDVVFSFADAQYTQEDFARYMTKFNRKSEPKVLTHFINQKFDDFQEKMILLYEEENLESKYKKFNFLMKEYHDGILLFDVTDRKVWSKAVKDTVGLEGFYEKNKENYQWDTRYDVHVLSADDKKLRKKVLKHIKKNPKADWAEIDSIYNASDSSAVVKEHWTVYEAGDNHFADELAEEYAKKLEKKGRVITLMDDSRVLDMRLRKPSLKALHEARGVITADYQNYLEKQWIKSLHEKYEVKIHEDVLKKLAQ
ncbi:MAG: peptidylprolyl isomerase [Bacteroidales bacterium]|jgi:peptidyl-prolyl cis-trans isomerase SurA|nr:peptidylprolyl isomerase [Bacteroidales bacterium]